MKKLDGPIPGENFTSDTKNYPWHRPPEHTDMDSAIDDIAKKLLDEDSATGILTMLANGVTIVEITDMFLTSGIGAGKWTPDFALLLAGPTSHIFYLMAKSYDIDCDLGIEDNKPQITRAFFDGFKNIDKASVQDAMADVNVDEVKKEATGFMAAGKGKK